MQKDLSIIIPSFNSGSHLIQCLKAVDIELKDQKGQYEIILVDSSPIAPELDDIKNLKLVHANLQLFPSDARNLGARMARFPILVFIDSDVEILPGALAKLTDGLKNNNAVTGGVYEVNNPYTSWISTSQDLFLFYRFENTPPAINFFSSALFAVSKDNFLKVGGFSENLQTYEDVDMSFKLQKQYLRVQVCLESRGYHLKNFTLKSISWDYYLKSRNMVYYRLKKINDLHKCGTFIPSNLRISYFLFIFYLLLLIILFIPNGPLPTSGVIIAFGLLLFLDIYLLIGFLKFIWRETQRQISVLKAFLLFKATSLPILLGSFRGFYSFLKKDESFLNKIRSTTDIVVTSNKDYPKI